MTNPETSSDLVKPAAWRWRTAEPRNDGEPLGSWSYGPDEPPAGAIGRSWRGWECEPLYDATTIERLTVERDEARETAEVANRLVAAVGTKLIAAESLVARQAEALNAIVTAWDNATRGNGNPERDLGWTGSRDNWGQIFAWYAKAALDRARSATESNT